MAIAFIQEWKGATPGTENYDAVAAKLGAESNPPVGLIAHTAGHGSDGTWRIFDIWESREQADQFYDGRVMPIVQEMMQQSDEMRGPDVTDSYELHDLIHP